jgi:multidrug resistance efflux pump
MRQFGIISSVCLITAVILIGCTPPVQTAFERLRSGLDNQRTMISDRLTAVGRQLPDDEHVLKASGVIEAPTMSVGSPLGGRVTQLAVTEGQAIRAGDLVAELDTALLDAEIAQAVAAERVALAQVTVLEAGAREADLDVARAAVNQAEAARDAARTVWHDAEAQIDAPSDLDVRIAAAEFGLGAAKQQLLAAQAGATAADLEMQLWARTVKALEDGFDISLPPAAGGGTRHVDAPSDKLGEARLQWNLASQRAWEAHAQAQTAITARNAASQALSDLRSQKAEPQALRAQTASAEAAYRVAEAAVETAQAALAVLQAGAPVEQIATARAAAARAGSAVQTLRTHKEQAKVVAQDDGVVSAVVLHAGEVAAPGAAIVRIYQPDEATLTVYVPTPDTGLVKIGREARVTVDSFPSSVFTGTVTHIAERAEFTPKNVQTRDARAGTVFAVKITLANTAGALKPGMPADAIFCTTRDAACAASLAVHAAATTPTSAAGVAIRASGVIETTDTAIAAEVTGRVVRIDLTEGDHIAAGQVAVVLDDSEWQARRAESQAAIVTAQTELARVLAAPQAARVAQAVAQVRQAQAGLVAAQTTLDNARTLRAQPQALDEQINAARSQFAIAVAQLDVARAQVKAARVRQESLPPDTGSDLDRTRRAMYDQGVEAAEAGLRAREASAQGAQAGLAALVAIRERPVALEAAVHRAEGSVAQAEAAVRVAQTALAQVRAPAQLEAVALAQARIAQAEAGLAAVDVALVRLTVRSPVSGAITRQAIHAGEIAQAGLPLLTVTDLGRTRLAIYVPTSQIGAVQLGQRAEIYVDAYPERIFGGTVARIADRAEFTPRNVQTQEERATTVFAVEIALENEEGLLRPGMPADARLSPE